MSSSTTRDTIQISLGPSANAITAHLLNLQGLAATSNDGESSSSRSVCDPQTTHRVEHNFWVPRALLVDEQTHFPSSKSTQPPEAAAISSWHGGVEPIDSNWNRPVSQLTNFLETSSILAYSSHSRFYQQPQQQNTYKVDSSNSRHVDWDEDDEDVEEEDPDERSRRLKRERHQWQNHTQAPLQEKLSTAWNESQSTAPTTTTSIDAAAATTSSPPAHPQQQLQWMDYWMPPFSQQSKIALPYSHQTNMISHWDHYQSSNGGLDHWREEELSERLRHILEDCDYCQGVTITTQGHGIYAGMTTSLLQELQEECKSAGRMVVHVTNPPKHGHDEQATPEETANPRTSSSEDVPEEAAWQPSMVERVRTNVQAALALDGFTQNANLVLPLRLDEKDKDSNLFLASARLAMALETSTLAYRLRPQHDPRYKIGLQNASFFGQGGNDSRWGTTAQRLSFGEFLNSLQPSSRHSLIELDTLATTPPANKNLWDQLQVGTSVERDQRMRESGRDAALRRPQNVPPGGWMNDAAHGGLMSSSSFASITDRSLHYHFALSTALRPSHTILPDESSPPESGGLSPYLTCLVEGMGIRYRPERSMCTVLNQSLPELTSGGYGAGAYWESILTSSTTQKATPVLAVLGNTTRVYPYLDQVTTDMKQVLAQRFRGYYNRDVLNGILPEVEDCQQVLADCLDVRDVYQPPESSGLVADTEGDYDPNQ
jgi:hypothetical protein